MAGDFSRRTHVVRVFSDPAAAKADPSSANFIDVEVLDAISFRTNDGKEVVIDCSQNVVPTIVDNTPDGNNGTDAGSGTTRLSHMKRITSDDGTASLDVEILDAWAARDTNGDEWILDMTQSSDPPVVFNTTTGDGDSTATRRVHDEKIAPQAAKDAPPGKQYIRSRRTDAIAFRRQNGDEVVFSCPSSDDPASSDPRAATFIVPDQYDPTDTSPSAVTPPANKDPNVYVAYVKDATGTAKSPLISVDDDKTAVDMGLLWWIRKVASGGDWLCVIMAGDGPGLASFDIIFPDPTIDSLFVVGSDVGTGSPHFPVFIHDAVFNTTAGRDAYVVAAADLKANIPPVTWVSGAKVTIFGTQAFDAETGTTIMTFINLKTLPQAPFKVQANISNPDWNTNIKIFLVKGLTAGKIIIPATQASLVAAIPPAGAIVGSPVDGLTAGQRQLAATVDPVKFTIKQTAF